MQSSFGLVLDFLGNLNPRRRSMQKFYLTSWRFPSTRKRSERFSRRRPKLDQKNQFQFLEKFTYAPTSSWRSMVLLEDVLDVIE